MSNKSLGLSPWFDHSAQQTNSLQPIVSDLLDNVAANIQTAKQMSNTDTYRLFDQSLDSVERSKFLPVNDQPIVQALQNVTDDISRAKHEVDKNGEQAVSKLLQQVLDDIAVTKYLSDANNQFSPLLTAAAQGVDASANPEAIKFDHDPLTEADLVMIQAEEDQMADLALSQRFGEVEKPEPTPLEQQSEIMAEIQEIDRDILALEEEQKEDNDPDDELYMLQEEEERFELMQIEQEIQQLEGDEGTPMLESLSQAQEDPRIRAVVPPSTLFDQIDKKERQPVLVDVPQAPFVRQAQEIVRDEQPQVQTEGPTDLEFLQEEQILPFSFQKSSRQPIKLQKPPMDLKRAIRGASFNLEYTPSPDEVDQYFNKMSGRHPLDDDGFPQRREFQGKNYEDANEDKWRQEAEQENGEEANRYLTAEYESDYVTTPVFDSDRYHHQRQPEQVQQTYRGLDMNHGPPKIGASLEEPCEEDCCIVQRRRKKKRKRVKRHIVQNDESSDDEHHGKGHDHSGHGGGGDRGGSGGHGSYEGHGGGSGRGVFEIGTTQPHTDLHPPVLHPSPHAAIQRREHFIGHVPSIPEVESRTRMGQTDVWAPSQQKPTQDWSLRPAAVYDTQRTIDQPQTKFQQPHRRVQYQPEPQRFAYSPQRYHYFGGDRGYHRYGDDDEDQPHYQGYGEIYGDDDHHLYGGYTHKHQMYVPQEYEHMHYQPYQAEQYYTPAATSYQTTPIMDPPPAIQPQPTPAAPTQPQPETHVMPEPTIVKPEPAPIVPVTPPIVQPVTHWESPEAELVKELEEENEHLRQEKEDLEKEKELEKQKEKLEEEIEDLKEHMPHSPKVKSKDDDSDHEHEVPVYRPPLPMVIPQPAIIPKPQVTPQPAIIPQPQVTPEQPQLPGPEITTGVNPYQLTGPAYPGITGVLPPTMQEKMPMFQPTPSAPSQQQYDRYQAPGSQFPTTGINPYPLTQSEYPGVAGVLPATMQERMPMKQPTPSAPSIQQWDRYSAPGTQPIASETELGLNPFGPQMVQGGEITPGLNPYALQQPTGITGVIPGTMGEKMPMMQPAITSPSIQQWDRYSSPGATVPAELAGLGATTGQNPYALQQPTGITGVLPGTVSEKMPMMQPAITSPSIQQWDRYTAPGATVPAELAGLGVTAGQNPYGLTPAYPGVTGLLPEVGAEKFPMRQPVASFPSEQQYSQFQPIMPQPSPPGSHHAPGAPSPPPIAPRGATWAQFQDQPWYTPRMYQGYKSVPVPESEIQPLGGMQQSPWAMAQAELQKIKQEEQILQDELASMRPQGAGTQTQPGFDSTAHRQLPSHPYASVTENPWAELKPQAPQPQYQDHEPSKHSEGWFESSPWVHAVHDQQEPHQTQTQTQTQAQPQVQYPEHQPMKHGTSWEKGPWAHAIEHQQKPGQQDKQDQQTHPAQLGDEAQSPWSLAKPSAEATAPSPSQQQQPTTSESSSPQQQAHPQTTALQEQTGTHPYDYMGLDVKNPWKLLLERIEKGEAKLEERETEMEKKVAELESGKSQLQSPKDHHIAIGETATPWKEAGQKAQTDAQTAEQHPPPIGETQTPWKLLLEKVQSEESQIADKEAQLEKKVAELERGKQFQLPAQGFQSQLMGTYPQGTMLYPQPQNYRVSPQQPQVYPASTQGQPVRQDEQQIQQRLAELERELQQRPMVMSPQQLQEMQRGWHQQQPEGPQLLHQQPQGAQAFQPQQQPIQQPPTQTNPQQMQIEWHKGQPDPTVQHTSPDQKSQTDQTSPSILQQMYSINEKRAMLEQLRRQEEQLQLQQSYLLQ